MTTSNHNDKKKQSLIECIVPHCHCSNAEHSENTNDPLHLIGHEWGSNTDIESKKLIKELESVVLKRVNVEMNGFRKNEWYIYIDVNDSDQDKVWINRCKYNYKPKSVVSGRQKVGYFNFFKAGQNWQIEFVNCVVQLFVFDAIIFTQRYQSIVDPDNVCLALQRYNTKNKQKQRQIELKRRQERKRREETELKLRKEEYFETAANIDKIQKKKVTQDEAHNKGGIKRKRNEVEIFNQIVVTIAINSDNNIQNEICFYRKHCYYDRQRHKNMPLIMEETPNKRRKISSSNIMKDDDYDLNDWWNAECCAKLQKQQHYDPGVCLPRLNDKYKKTCYPPPPVYDSFTKCPESAPFPYIVRETMSMISDGMFLKKALIYLWDKGFEVDFMKRLSISYDYYLEEPQIVSASDYDNCNASVVTDHSFNILYSSSLSGDTSKHYKLHELIEINERCDDVLKQWCMEHLMKDDEFDSIFNDIEEEEEEEEIVNIDSKCKESMRMWKIMEMYLGDKEEDESPRKYLKMDHADDVHRDALHFMNFKQDVLNGKQMAHLNISTCCERCEWHHDLGLCTWFQLIDGENNIKIWDVEATKMIEECKYNKELTEEKKDYYISSIQPIWEIFLRPGVVLYVPSGSGYLITTTSSVAVMITGCFLPHTHIRIGYEMARYHRLDATEQDLTNVNMKQSVDWDTIIIRETANVFNVNDKQLFIAHDNNEDNTDNCNNCNDEYISIPKRLQYLERYSKQHNWNIRYEINGHYKLKKKKKKHCTDDDEDDGNSVTFD